MVSFLRCSRTNTFITLKVPWRQIMRLGHFCAPQCTYLAWWYHSKFSVTISWEEKQRQMLSILLLYCACVSKDSSLAFWPLGSMGKCDPQVPPPLLASWSSVVPSLWKAELQGFPWHHSSGALCLHSGGWLSIIPLLLFFRDWIAFNTFLNVVSMNIYVNRVTILYKTKCGNTLKE